MSSEALKRIRELAENGRLHTWDIRRASDGHMSAVEADVSPDVLALLAEVARLEQEADFHAHSYDEWRERAKTAEAALAVAREREQRLRGEIRRFIATEYPDGTEHPADSAADRLARAALADENPMEPSGEPAAATLAEPEQDDKGVPRACSGARGTEGIRDEAATALPDATVVPGSASAAADEPGETP